MHNIDLHKISSLISQKLNKRIRVTSIEKIGSGYHSDGFKLSTKNGRSFFLKRVKSHDLGFEIPERRVSSLLVSNGMFRRAGFKPQPIGIVLDNGEETMIMPEVTEDTAIYHIQEFEPEGISYWSLLQGRKQKAKIDKQDLDELKKITNYIYSVHKIRHPSLDVARLKSVYNDALRSVLTHPELTVMLLHDFPVSHPLLPPKKQKEYVGLMLSLLHQWKDRYDRLVALHGDFWGANLFFKNDGSLWVVDYSRIPWGDSGIDIGWWLHQYLWFYHETGNNYFMELGEKFLELYIKKSKDKEICQAVSLALGFCGVVNISPRIYPDFDMEIGKKFFDNILEILRGGKFTWKK